MSDIMRYPVCETQDDVLDCFDVLGADEGNLICLECAREFNPNELLLSKTKEKSMTKNTEDERTATVRMHKDLHAALKQLADRWHMSANRACVRLISQAVCAEEPDALSPAIKQWRESDEARKVERGE
jgi:predicted transcriptional regulator